MTLVGRIIHGSDPRESVESVFTTFEVITVGLAVAIVSLVAIDGESNWMEGVLLLAVCLIFAIGFFFLPASVPVV